MIVLHVAPVNPVTLDLQPVVSGYTVPLFQQNWRLFAPEPISVEHGILVRARVKDEDGNEKVTAFYDVTSPVIHTIHSNRVFPPRHTRLITTINQLLGYRDPVAQRYREAQLADLALPDQELLDARLDVLPLTPGEEATHELAIEMLRTVASEAARSQWGDGVTHIEVRFATNQFPPFSERGSGEDIGELHTSDSGWLGVAN